MDSICIVIPFYNEAFRFPINEFLEFLHTDKETVFCLVDDGSSDETGGLLLSIKERYPDRILLKVNAENKGKADAVRLGMLSAMEYFPSNYFAFFDADLATSLEEAFHLRSILLANPNLEYAFGSRIAILGVHIKRRLHRHLIGRVIATFISNILHLMVYDTQCGAKLFKRSLAMKVFEKPFITTWLFDVEILARIIGMYGRNDIEKFVIEVPVKSWIDKGGSKISWIYGFRVFIDLVRIKFRYYKLLKKKHREEWK
jgi:dolichyl-phosphate beta-glucosyltransferase